MSLLAKILNCCKYIQKICWSDRQCYRIHGSKCISREYLVRNFKDLKFYHFVFVEVIDVNVLADLTHNNISLWTKFSGCSLRMADVIIKIPSKKRFQKAETRLKSKDSVFLPIFSWFFSLQGPTNKLFDPEYPRKKEMFNSFYTMLF